MYKRQGYKPAGAYVNGELVAEPGGGVCQVSSTLYNAVVFAGLKTTERHAHSYEPSYVTPGEDAAVSYGGPDMKFINNSDTAIALRAKLEGSLSSKMTLTISVVGIPILEDGVTYSMHSEKVCLLYTSHLPSLRAAGSGVLRQTAEAGGGPVRAPGCKAG